MEIKGKIIKLLAPQTGEGKNGKWTKQEYILETSGEYPKKVCFEIWNDKIKTINLNVNDVIKNYYITLYQK